MPYEQTEAIVLRKVDFSETSRIVTFLTPCRGRMACMARGARRKGSPLGAALDTYNRLELTYTWKDSRQVQNLVEATVLDAFAPLKFSVPHSAAAAFILDTALHASCENHAAPELFQALVQGLEMLSRGDSAPFSLAGRVVYALLEGAGIAPEPAEEECQFLLDRFPPGERRRLWEALVRLGVSDAPLEPEITEAMLDFLHDYVTHHFEAPLRSYPFLKTILRNT